MTAKEIRLISPTEALKKIEQGTTLVDVREYMEWAAGYVPQAILVPLEEFTRGYQVNNNAPDIILMCRSGKRAMEAAQIVAERGGNPLVIEGGFEAWRDNGFPTEKAEHAPMSMERQVRIAAGSLVLLGLVSKKLRPLSFFVAGGLIFSGITDFCGMAKVLGKMPWNQKPGSFSCPFIDAIQKKTSDI